MHNIHAENVNVALSEGISYLLAVGTQESSRNGTVLVAPGPVCTTYYRPTERVLFSPMRDANPFFHLFESLWMLAGRNDLAYPLRFAKNIGNYSDDGKTLWGAYGWRWREFFGYDQLYAIIGELRKNPSSRRCVLAMWNGMDTDGCDCGGVGTGVQPDHHVAIRDGKDVPCNTHAYFDVRDGKLNMTVCCRSNDIIWGAYGANAVHFSILLEYMALMIGVEVGVYRQISNNFHAYTDLFNLEKLRELANDADETNFYDGPMQKVPLMLTDADPDGWHDDLRRMVRIDGIPNDNGWNTPFFSTVARPMFLAHDAWRDKDYGVALNYVNRIQADDWRIACKAWITRRMLKPGRRHE
jgi:hypothetical protein